MCEIHVGQRRQIDVEIRQRRDDINIVIQAIARAPIPTWQAFMDEIVARHDLDRGRQRQIADAFHERARVVLIAAMAERTWARQWFDMRWAWAVTGRLGPEPAAPAPLVFPQAGFQPPARAGHTLGRLAADAQNVHTSVVTKQTNQAVDKLIAVEVPSTQQTERQITVAWLSFPKPPGFNEYLRVATDVNRWFLTNTCRTESDNLYRKLLRGLVAMIEKQSGETKVELYKRLWEECREATGMCCEGHISRLCNVLVGFDESFQPPVSLGEILQNKMSAIAALMDVPTETKIQHANAVFEELGVPVEERVAWLEAF